MARSHIKEKEKRRRTGAPRPSSIPFFRPVCGSGMRNTHCKPALFVRWTTPRPTGTETHAFLLCHILLTSSLYPFSVTLQPFSASVGSASLAPAPPLSTAHIYSIMKHSFRLIVSFLFHVGRQPAKNDEKQAFSGWHALCYLNQTVRSAHTGKASGKNLWIFSKTSGFSALFII